MPALQNPFQSASLFWGQGYLLCGVKNMHASCTLGNATDSGKRMSFHFSSGPVLASFLCRCNILMNLCADNSDDVVIFVVYQMWVVMHFLSFCHIVWRHLIENAHAHVIIITADVYITFISLGSLKLIDLQPYTAKIWRAPNCPNAHALYRCIS